MIKSGRKVAQTYLTPEGPALTKAGGGPFAFCACKHNLYKSHFIFVLHFENLYKSNFIFVSYFKIFTNDISYLFHTFKIFTNPISNLSHILREVVKKNPGYFTVRLTVRVDPPPYGQLICVFF